MKTITINKDSWHFWIARKGGDYDPEVHGADICAYLRRIGVAVIGAAFISAIVLAGGSVAAYFLGDFVAWLIFVLIHGWIGPQAAAFVLLVLVIGAIIGVVWLFCRGTKAAVENVEVIGAAWESVHDRICARIRID